MFYNKKIAEEYASAKREEDPVRYDVIYDHFIRKCFEVAGELDNLKVTDFACGDGLSSRFLAQAGAKVHGIDRSPYLIEQAKKSEMKTQHGITYEVFDLRKALKLAVKYRLITGAYFLHYANNKEELKMFIRNIAGNLLEGGSFVGINIKPVPPIENSLVADIEWSRQPYAEGSLIMCHLKDSTGKHFITVRDFYWPERTCQELFAAYEMSFQWEKFSMPQDKRLKYPNWQEMISLPLCIVYAKKI
jgi:SAM-dependent methyltransferase